MDSLSLTKTFHHNTYPAISPLKPTLSQAGKTVLITGGGDEKGIEIARSFAKASASRIILVSRRIGVLEDAASKLQDEFKATSTIILARQVDLADLSSIADLWDYLHAQKIFVHVLVLNATCANVGGGITMSQRFAKQPLRPEGQQLNLVNLLTASLHMDSPNYARISKAAFAGILGRIANERSVKDIQIISVHPGMTYSESDAKLGNLSVHKWDKPELVGDFSVWASSTEAAWLHGCFVWANWDVEELKDNHDFVKRVKEEKSFLKLGVAGLSAPTFEDFESKLYM
ncbi:hypothetical protein GYMLUDRAFT_400549 [Collybiopsis luxurians FD-317 M1]|nr:hypothetical protein GYMLUDRAFT_400549 [Collybiopsis luxurians FD-317 M1]